jgi:hypothetical protein
MEQTKIIYSGFYDALLAFVAKHEGKQYLFWRGNFDEELDGYPSIYEVFNLPNLTDDEINASWSSLADRAEIKVGRIHMGQVLFDPSKRESIDSATFDRLDTAH